MKLQNIIASACVALGIVSMVSCKDDNGSNPVYHKAESFQVYAGENMGNVIDLKNTTDSLEFTWSQPDYGGMPLAVTYNYQMSLTGEFNEAYTDTTGADIPATYVAGDNPVSKCSMKLCPEAINSYILQSNKIEKEEDLPSTITFYYRFTATTKSDVIYSNVIPVTYRPYFVKLSVADPHWWYLTGDWVGTSGWGGDLGTGMIPMYPATDDKGKTSVFDASTGHGTISWTGYVGTTGFKIRGSLTDGWATQIGQGGSFGEFKLKDDSGEGGNIAPDAAGLYTITIDTKLADAADASCITMTQYTDNAPVYSDFYMMGSFDGWGSGLAMSPVHANVENHDWCITTHIAAGTEIKFQTGGWAREIGYIYPAGESIPSSEGTFYGVGAGSGGGNIYIGKEGDYYIQINDITNAFIFIKK